ncbi:MAG TPA: hypothetical protein PK681_03005 [Steroidobacteraceae bacterium]|nr:hypothetical protein [Steroidobacteraceae bacterium]HQW07984.1 hypothetical protein [Steroidobacteraceae bacterium]HQX47983.1 hypothetical protein [Steroidobacteraceae bacterium]HQX77223.1 hypothetical protein [Steroidobacteraceae bacterium]HQZ79565.1 hypothetical protein [Steroidobacteraceae bacterium]
MRRTVAWPIVSLWAGLTAGALDILAAVVINTLRGSTPMRVLQSVASGLLGQPAFDGGWSTALLGLVLHFAMMLIIAAFFCALASRMAWARRQPLLAGSIYGVAVYAVMNIIVVPLSAFPVKLSYPPSALAIGLLVHIVVIGVPMALIVARLRVPAGSAVLR